MEVEVDLSVENERYAFSRQVKCELYSFHADQKQVAVWKHSRNVIGLRRPSGAGIGVVVPAACQLLSAAQSGARPKIPLLPEYRPFIVETEDVDVFSNLTIHIDVRPTSSDERIGLDRLEVRIVEKGVAQAEDDPFNKIRYWPSSGASYKNQTPKEFYAGWRAVLALDLRAYKENAAVRAVLSKYTTNSLLDTQDLASLRNGPWNIGAIPATGAALTGRQHPPCPPAFYDRSLCTGEQVTFAGILGVSRKADQSYLFDPDAARVMHLYKWQPKEKLRPGHLNAWVNDFIHSAHFEYKGQVFSKNGKGSVFLLDVDAEKLYQLTVSGFALFD
jgi:hypothetical protein